MLRDETVPEGFSVRLTTPDDAAAIAELINEVTTAEAGFPWTTTEETRDELTMPRDDATPSDVILVDGAGAFAGYLQVTKWDTSEFQLIAFAPPRLWGQGLSAWLIRRGEMDVVARAGGPGSSVVARVARFAGNEPA
ncbi:MAG: hypothetical protein ACRDG2_09035, partial [Actinomycetota bacterium]